MATCNELDKLDNKLSLIRSRLYDLRMERERLEEEIKQKALNRALRESLKDRIAAIDGQIKTTQGEEWDADSERYDRLYGWPR